MQRMDRTIGRAMTHKQAEENKIFPADTSYAQRLSEAWHLTCRAFGIDPKNPPKMDKNFASARKRSE